MDIRLKLKAGNGLDDNILKWLDNLNVSSRQASTVIKVKLNEAINRAPGRDVHHNAPKTSAPGRQATDDLDKKIQGMIA